MRSGWQPKAAVYVGSTVKSPHVSLFVIYMNDFLPSRLFRAYLAFRLRTHEQQSRFCRGRSTGAPDASTLLAAVHRQVEQQGASNSGFVRVGCSTMPYTGLAWTALFGCNFSGSREKCTYQCVTGMSAGDLNASANSLSPFDVRWTCASHYTSWVPCAGRTRVKRAHFWHRLIATAGLWVSGDSPFQIIRDDFLTSPSRFVQFQRILNF